MSSLCAKFWFSAIIYAKVIANNSFSTGKPLEEFPNFFFADSASFHTYPVNPAYKSASSILNPFSGEEVFENVINPESCESLSLKLSHVAIC